MEAVREDSRVRIGADAGCGIGVVDGGGTRRASAELAIVVLGGALPVMGCRA